MYISKKIFSESSMFLCEKRLELVYPKFISNFLLHISARFVFCLDHQTFCKWQRWMTFYDCYLFFLLLCTNVEIAFLVFQAFVFNLKWKMEKLHPSKRPIQEIFSWLMYHVMQITSDLENISSSAWMEFGAQLFPAAYVSTHEGIVYFIWQLWMQIKCLRQFSVKLF